MEKRIGADQWVVFPHYEIVDGQILGFGSLTHTRTYYPLEHPELVSELAKTDPTDETQILDFVHHYGKLGGSPEDDRTWQSSEPVVWIQRHIETVRLLLELAKCSTDNDEEAAARLCGEEEWHAGTVAGVPRFRLVSRTDEYDVPSGLTLNTPLGRVRYIACAIINDNIREVSRKAFMLPNGEGIKSAFYFSALIDTIYWHILNAIEGATEIGRCQWCHTPFIKTDGRQRFCPKRYGETESRCALAFRQRQYREKKGI